MAEKKQARPQQEPRDMQAAVFYEPNRIGIQRVPLGMGVPAVKVSACAVCGYDVRVFRNGHRKVSPPVILGHEIAGKVREDILTGNGTIKKDTRVVLCPLVPCLQCHYCQADQYNMCSDLKEVGSTHDGGFAEYVCIPEQILKIGGLVEVPDSLSDEEASLLEPLACCVQGLRQLGLFDRSQDDRPVVVVGDGPIGLMHLQILKNWICARHVIVVGKIPSRMSYAQSCGADTVLEYGGDIEEKVCRAVGKAGARAIIIATSNPVALGLVEKVSGKNSKVSLFAGMPAGQKLSLDANWVHYNQVSVTGSFSSSPDSLEEAAEIASDKAVDLSRIITHRFALAEIEKAFLATEGYEGLRVVVNKF